MSRTMLTILAVAALLPALALAQPGRSPALKNDGAYSGMNRSAKVDYLTSVIDAGRQSAFAAKEKDEEIKKLKEKWARIDKAAKELGADGVSSAAAGKLAQIDAEIAAKEVEKQKLLETARRMAEEARKRKALDATIHRDALEAVQRREGGQTGGPNGSDEPLPNRVKLLGKKDQSPDK